MTRQADGKGVISNQRKDLLLRPIRLYENVEKGSDSLVILTNFILPVQQPFLVDVQFMFWKQFGQSVFTASAFSCVKRPSLLNFSISLNCCQN
jgi:hypothetical protein